MSSVNPIYVSTGDKQQGLDLLVSDVNKLVSLPDIYYRLEELILEPSSTTDSTAGLLRKDPDLCARILSVANSAFYSFPTRIETIDRAVNVIGLRQIRELVLVTTVIRAFEGIPAGIVDMSVFWEHSVAVALLACEIGSRAGIARADTFYVPGLLHDLGRLVMYLKLPQLMTELLEARERTGRSLHELEQERLNYTHADIGGRLLEFWKLPPSIWEPVATHHHPASGGEYAVVASAIHAADVWVNTNRTGSSGDGFGLDMDIQALDLIAIDFDGIDQAGQIATEKTHSVVRQFMSH